jgi:formate dehydrogenase major subunit
LGRTEVDARASGPQFVTIEDSFGTVHRSVGKLDPPSPEVHSEVAIVAGIAGRLVPDCGVPWKAYADDYRAIRSDVAAIIPGFERFEERVLEPGGFLLPHPPRDRREFPTPSGKAQFSAELLHTAYGHAGGLVLQTLRSHDQFNTTIYGLDDRYRGVSGGRRVVLVNPVDLSRLGFEAGGLVDIVAGERIASGFRLVAYETPLGCVAAYYPEANVLVGLDDRSSESGTPSFKSIPVTLTQAVSPTARPAHLL